MNSPTPIKAFVSYAHEDSEAANALFKLIKKHAKASGKRKWTFWKDDQLLPGESWDAEISNGMKESNLAFFFVSAGFLASDYIMDIEFKELLMKRTEKGTSVIPVYLRECDFSKWENLSAIQFFKMPQTDDMIPFEEYCYEKRYLEKFGKTLIQQSEAAFEKNLNALSQISTQISKATGLSMPDFKQLQKTQKKFNKANRDHFSVERETAKWIDKHRIALSSEFMAFYSKDELNLFYGLEKEEVKKIFEELLQFIYCAYRYSISVNIDEMKKHYKQFDQEVPIDFSEDVQNIIKFLENYPKDDDLSKIAQAYLLDRLNVLRQIFKEVY